MQSELVPEIPTKALYADWIWSTWLRKSAPSRLNYQRFIHEEYIEDETKRPVIEERLATLLYQYHASSPVNVNLLTQLRYKQLGRAFTNISDQRPHHPDTRKGNFVEILACEFAKKHGFDVPVLRLRYNPNPDQSMKGDDILGFRFSDMENGRDTVFVGEGKFRSQVSNAREAVSDAYADLLKKANVHPTSIEFIANILSLSGEKSKAARIRQMQQLLTSQPHRIEQKHLLFLGTVNTPPSPFKYLEEYEEELLPNLRAVNVVFKEGLQNWIAHMYEKECVL